MKTMSYAFIFVVGLAALSCCAQETPDQSQYVVDAYEPYVKASTQLATLMSNFEQTMKFNEFLKSMKERGITTQKGCAVKDFDINVALTKTEPLLSTQLSAIELLAVQQSAIFKQCGQDLENGKRDRAQVKAKLIELDKKDAEEKKEKAEKAAAKERAQAEVEELERKTAEEKKKEEEDKKQGQAGVSSTELIDKMRKIGLSHFDQKQIN